MEIINLTPHDINILDTNLRPVATIARSMKVARLDSDKQLLVSPEFDFEFPMFLTKYRIPYLVKINEQGDELERVQFPERKEDVIYIVSGLFRASYDRSDLWQPGELMRDNSGRPIGCIGLSQ